MSYAIKRGDLLHIDATQQELPSSAPVLDFICLFTHDLKRKQKRWQDGKLKYHTFNRRVMVYDDRGGFIGDAHWQADGDLVEGEELRLDRGGAIVQVAEYTGATEQDLTEMLDKRAKEVEKRRQVAAARTPTVTARNPAAGIGPSHTIVRPETSSRPHFQLHHRPLGAIVPSPGPIGRASIPGQSPYEARRAEGHRDAATTATISVEGAAPPAKRRRVSVSPPSKSGHARSLFGTKLTLSGCPSSLSQLREKALRERMNIRAEQAPIPPPRPTEEHMLKSRVGEVAPSSSAEVVEVVDLAMDSTPAGDGQTSSSPCLAQTKPSPCPPQTRLGRSELGDKKKGRLASSDEERETPRTKPSEKSSYNHGQKTTIATSLRSSAVPPPVEKTTRVHAPKQRLTRTANPPRQHTTTCPQDVTQAASLGESPTAVNRRVSTMIARYPKPDEQTGSQNLPVTRNVPDPTGTSGHKVHDEVATSPEPIMTTNFKEALVVPYSRQPTPQMDEIIPESEPEDGTSAPTKEQTHPKSPPYTTKDGAQESVATERSGARTELRIKPRKKRGLLMVSEKRLPQTKPITPLMETSRCNADEKKARPKKSDTTEWPETDGPDNANATARFGVTHSDEETGSTDDAPAMSLRGSRKQLRRRNKASKPGLGEDHSENNLSDAGSRRRRQSASPLSQAESGDDSNASGPRRAQQVAVDTTAAAGPRITKLARKSVKSREIIGFAAPAGNLRLVLGAQTAVHIAAPAPEPSPHMVANDLINSAKDAPDMQSHESTAEQSGEHKVGEDGSPPAAKPKIINPASRGRKAAAPGDAVSPMPQTLVPFDPVPPRLNHPQVRATTTAPDKGRVLPGFQSARGAWSRHAQDLLGMDRPAGKPR